MYACLYISYVYRITVMLTPGHLKYDRIWSYFDYRMAPRRQIDLDMYTCIHIYIYISYVYRKTVMLTPGRLKYDRIRSYFDYRMAPLRINAVYNVQCLSRMSCTPICLVLLIRTVVVLYIYIYIYIYIHIYMNVYEYMHI
jgi:hypothetical protein